ncbi:hypothetical protein SYNPS1DRAFT_22153 [Syncephalis pseudoplumigaleata]|uniref:Uncharacterized protein n=1 Tax=Syncephalis pseudoplumigaleata TaxID=1712513 RepID=A0A4P9Z0J9_9FUNG|nr:hypothetical protein SYNPS1DRAFT_22153 [Syncephalis pseudoplumigaleata]|eukprot:RKP25987.1 hypothetical protein SYNPS1DRAFT_22153 [Syncephalis pseudoplumigaleata]
MSVRRSSHQASPTADSSANTSWMDRLRTATSQLATTKRSERRPSDPGHPYTSEPSSSRAAKRRRFVEDASAANAERGGSSVQWPVIILALPPIGSLFVGTAQGWSDSIALVLIGLYLFQLATVPWELYHAARTDAAMRKAAMAATATPEQRRALAQLRWQEKLSFALVLLAPFLGGYTLHLAKHYLAIAHYLTPSSILLYVMVASMRPFRHAAHMLQGRAMELQRDISWQDSDAAQLQRRLDELEMSLRELRLACATEDDIDVLKEELHTVLDEMARGTRHHARREHKARMQSASRIDRAERRVREVEEWCERQRTRHSHSMLLRLVWEPVSLFREAVGVAAVPLLGFGGLIGGSSRGTQSAMGAALPAMHDDDDHEDAHD